MLVRRGVRRVFAVKVREVDEGTAQAGPVTEWLPSEDRWAELDPESEIVDRCLKSPLTVKALIDVTEARAQVLRGFVADDHPLLVEDRQKAVAAREKELVAIHAGEMRAQARQAILDLCEVLAIAVTAERREHLEAMSAAELDARRTARRAGRRWPENAGL